MLASANIIRDRRVTSYIAIKIFGKPGALWED